MPRVGGKRKKKRTHKDVDHEEEAIMGNNPKSFIFKRGKVNGAITQLVKDMRELMYPYTSMKLKESDKSKIKDYLNACKVYGISNMLIFTSSLTHNYLRLLKTPQGPTLTFKIVSYCTIKEVIAAINKSFSRVYNSPLLIMNGFSKISKEIQNAPNQQHYDIVVKLIQSLYPSLSLRKCKIQNQKKCVLFQYDATQDTIIMRQYHIDMVQNVKNQNLKQLLLIQNNKLPNLHSFRNFKQFVNQTSINIEINTEEQQQIQDKQKQYQIQLTETGPRLKLKLYKIEEGLMNGNVLYNRMVQKTDKEIEKQRLAIKEKLKLKQERKEEQQKNVEKKQKEKLSKMEAGEDLDDDSEVDLEDLEQREIFLQSNEEDNEIEMDEENEENEEENVEIEEDNEADEVDERQENSKSEN